MTTVSPNTGTYTAKSFKDDFENASLQTLYRKMKKTSKARFNAATRLMRHQTFSLWTMSLFSAGLMVLQLLGAYKIPIGFSDSSYQFIQMALGLLVLVLSLLLTSNKFSERSEKMHRCALEINNLCNKILPKCKDDNDSALYNKTLTEYNTILDANENHEQIDFAYVKLSLPEDYQFTKTQRFCVHARYWLDIGFMACWLCSC